MKNDRADPSGSRLIAMHKGIALHANDRDEPYIEAPDHVLILPLNYAGEILFAHDTAAPDDTSILTLPGGAVHEGEAAEEAARRVLEAVTGFRAEVWFALGTTLPLARYALWRVHFFVARDLVPARPMSDAVYQRPTTRAALDAFEALIAAGQVRDSNLIALLYMAQRFITGHLRPDAAGR